MAPASPQTRLRAPVCSPLPHSGTQIPASGLGPSRSPGPACGLGRQPDWGPRSALTGGLHNSTSSGPTSAMGTLSQFSAMAAGRASKALGGCGRALASVLLPRRAGRLSSARARAHRARPARAAPAAPTRAGPAPPPPPAPHLSPPSSLRQEQQCGLLLHSGLTFSLSWLLTLPPSPLKTW